MHGSDITLTALQWPSCALKLRSWCKAQEEVASASVTGNAVASGYVLDL